MIQRLESEQLELFPSERKVSDYVKIIAGHWTQGFGFEDSLVALFKTGSHSHGTFIPTTEPLGIDDEDFMAVVIPPKENVLGLHRFEGCEIKQGSLDVVVYEWGKYIRLLLKSNPNVLGTLWIRPAIRNDPFPILLNQKQSIFASKKAYDPFIGYARAQLHKMQSNSGLGYMGAKRKALVEKHGYDTKNAAHLIRLMRMCVEFLGTGEMTVYRPDAQELMDIKLGKWSLDEVLLEAKTLFEKADVALAASTLQDTPDEETAERILIRGYLKKWRI